MESVKDQGKAVMDWMNNDCQGKLMLNGKERTVNPVVVQALRSFRATVSELMDKLRQSVGQDKGASE